MVPKVAYENSPKKHFKADIICKFILQGELPNFLHSFYTSHHHYQGNQADSWKQCTHNEDAAENEIY
jgi:hypothetical protein